MDENSGRLQLLTRIEDLLNGLADKSGDLKGQREAGIVFPCLYGVYRLPRNTQMFGEDGLRPVALGAQNLQTVFHSYRLRANIPPSIQSPAMTGHTNIQLTWGSPTFSRNP